MRTNRPQPRIKTHGGGDAVKLSALRELEKTVACCLLFEETFYEPGTDMADRIAKLSKEVEVEELCEMAVRTRTELHLRHVSLYLCCLALERDRSGGRSAVVARAIEQVIQRADELTEILALWWKAGRRSLPRALKVGIARAFPKFSAYALAKYDRANSVKLRDALFLSHAKPKDDEQAATWKLLIDGRLESPDTWEVALSSGADKRATWERLIVDRKLGGMALLRNLRNMIQAGVPKPAIAEALRAIEWRSSRVLPFRFIAAAKYAPDLEAEIDAAMVSAMSGQPRLAGRTLVVVDVSGSMRAVLSSKSEMTRIDAACGLAIILRSTAEDCVVYATAGSDATRIHATRKVPPRRGMALRDAILGTLMKLGGGGIFLVQAMEFISEHERDPFDRVVVVTDEQDCENRPGRSMANAQRLGKSNYILNVASYKPSLPCVRGGGWTELSGFSERSIDWMVMAEEVAGLQAPADG